MVRMATLNATFIIEATHLGRLAITHIYRFVVIEPLPVPPTSGQLLVVVLLVDCDGGALGGSSVGAIRWVEMGIFRAKLSSYGSY